MKAFTPRKRYNLISLITFAAILLSFGYYYFFYLDSMEVQFRDKAFRIIEKVGKNVEGKYKNYNSSITYAIDHVLKYKKIDNGHSKSISEEQLRYEFDSLNVPAEFKVEYCNFHFWTNSNSNETHCEKDIDYLLFDSIVGQEVVVNYRVNKNTTIRKRSSKILILKESSVKIEYPIDSLFKNTLRYDFFDKYVIFSNNRILYSDIPASVNESLKMDTLFKKNAFISTEFAEIEYDNKLHDLYITPINIGTEHTLYIGGIVDKEYFKQQTFKLNPIAITIIVFFVVFIFLSLPLLKLLLISEDERLNKIDAVLSFVSILLGGAFLFLIVLYLFAQKGPSKIYGEDYLKNYSEKIEGNFTKEIHAILKQIDTNNFILNSMNEIDLNINFPQDKSKDPDMSFYQDYVNTTWLNRNAIQLVKWRNGKNTSRVRVKSRDYYKFPQNNNLWKLGHQMENDTFYIEFIRAWTDRESYAMVSTRLPESQPAVAIGQACLYSLPEEDLIPTVITLGTRFQSLKNLQLPSNICYMLIDQNGKVLYHTNETKVLQENLVDETNKSIKLKNSLYKHTESFFHAYYDASDRKFYVNPVGNLPLYIVVYSDENRDNIRDIQVLSMTSTLYFILFSIIMFVVFIYAWVDYKRNHKTKAFNLFFKWIWPVESKSNTYIVLSVYLILSLMVYFLAGFYTNIYSASSYFVMLILANLLALNETHKVISWGNGKKYILFFLFGSSLALIVFFCTMPAFNQVSIIIGFVIYVIITVFAFIVLSGRIGKCEQISKTFPIFSTNFNLYIMMLVISICLAPLVTFFIKAHSFENDLYVHNLQYSLAKKIGTKRNINKSEFANTETLNKSYYFVKPAQEHEVKDEAEQQLFKTLRFSLRLKEKNSETFGITGPSAEQLYKWTEDKKVISLDYGGADGLHISSPKIKIDLAEIIKNKDNMSSFIVVLGVAVLILLFFLFKLISFWSNKIFLIKMVYKPRNEFDALIESHEYSYVVSPPYSGAVHYIRNLYPALIEIDLKRAEDRLYCEDKLETIRNQNAATVMVFDTDLENTPMVIIKTRLMLELKSIIRSKELKADKRKVKKSRIIFVSYSHPSYKTKIVAADNMDVEERDSESIRSYVNVMGDFSRIYFPIGYEKKKKDIITDTTKKSDKIKLYMDESILKFSEINGDMDEEDKVLHVQRIAQNYFYCLWNSLKEREHFLVYDIAQDGLVNYRNLPVLYNLINKGVLVNDNDGRLKLFSAGFQNFVLTIVDRQQSLLIERKARQSGNWANLRLPIIMVIFALFVFIFMTQQDVFNDIVGWITAAIGSLPILVRVMTGIAGISLFTSKSSDDKQPV